MIKRDQGKTKTMYFPKAASTAFTDGNFVTFDGSGHVIPATSTSASILGVGRRTVASGDSDYASTTLYPVQVPIEKYVTWYADTTTGVLATMQGKVGVSVDLTSAGVVNTAASTHHVVTVAGVVSTVQTLVWINATCDYAVGA